MKKFKRIVSAILLFCMIITFIPPVPKASAATDTATYVRATGELKSGKKYLIVYKYTTNNEYYALTTDNTVPTGNSIKLTSANDDIVTLSDTSKVDWTFEQTAANTYTIRNNNSYLVIPRVYWSTDIFQADPFEVTIAEKAAGNGQYLLLGL